MDVATKSEPLNLQEREAFPPRFAWAFCLGFAVLTGCLGWATGDLLGNEGLRARVAAEMAANSSAHAPLGPRSWWVPRLDGEPLLTKPPLQYWMVAALGRCTGRVGALEARFPSVIGWLVLVGLACRVGYRKWGNAGALSTLLVMPLSLAVLTQVPSAELDLPLCAWVFGGLVAWEALVRSGGEFGLAWWGLGLCLLGGFLQKWTGPAFMLPVIGFWLVWKKDWRLLARPLPWMVAVVVLAGALGWLVMAGRETGWEVLWQTVVRREGLEHLSPAHHGRPYPFHEWATYPFQVLAMGLPGCLALGGWALVSQDRRNTLSGDGWLQILFLGVVLPLLFWTLIPGHKPRHALPVIPPLMALSAGVLASVWPQWNPRYARRASVALAVVAVIWVGIKAGQVTLKAFRAGQAASPTQVARELALVLEREGAQVQVGLLRDDGLLLALADLGIRVDRRRGGEWRTDSPILVTAAERAHFGGAGLLLEGVDQQGKPIFLLDRTTKP